MGNARSKHSIADESRLSRRDAIKKGIAGAAAAGLVWSAPRIEGLSLRPSYAAAQSGLVFAVDFLEGSGSAAICGNGSFAARGSRSSESEGFSGSYDYLGAMGTINRIDVRPASLISPLGDTRVNLSSSGPASGTWRALPSPSISVPARIHIEFNCL